MIEGKNGPTPVKAKIEKPREGPSLKTLPSSFTDDDASTSITSKPNILLRLTLAKDSADQALASQLVGKPHFPPAVAFNESLRKAVAQTRGAVDYEHEATCLTSVRAEDVQKFLQASLPTGIFLKQHKGSSVPHWFHKHSQSNSEYYVRITKTCKSRSVVAWYIVLQLRLRWACLTPLKQSLIASLLGGILPTHPPEWGEEEITNWISQRGFARATGCRRQGRRPGFFRAHSPTDAENTNVAFVFKSGISMAPARAVGTKNYSAITQPKASWVLLR